MSHVLEGYDGPCSQIHGHSYRLFVTVRGVPSSDPADPKLGMVLDFGVLKKIVGRLVVDRFDHALMIRETTENAELVAALCNRFTRIITVTYQPTCENLIAWIASAVAPELPVGVELHSLRLHETATSFAEWFAADNH